MPGLSLASRLDGAIGGKTATAFDKAFGVTTVGELLEHYPRRYARRGELTPIASLPLGEPVTIVAEVVSANERRMQNRRGSLLEVVISDGDGRMSLTFFNQPWRLKDLTPGRRGIFSGKVGEYR
ncbi:OB-fold nucleic acid binding domain-containing protein, partial [uncultured Microbacterium sp.]|uniref:OB-fold nucleic acid binding domain-containing protein n=1 Tax=uncultured Microbacterium sp. TaxID=191216 RepID=UPI00345BB0C1